MRATNRAHQDAMSDRLVLGTAQLGLDYGVANKTGKPNRFQAEEIVRVAWQNGIREIDTAQGYGTSEDVLGQIISLFQGIEELRITTKPHPQLNHLDEHSMKSALEASLQKLRLSSLYGFMLHKESFLDLWHKGLGDILTGFVRQGLVKHIGISVYHPDRALDALRTDGIDFVQLPTNILDRRFAKAGAFAVAKELGKAIYIRSVFLQGLLLLDENQLPFAMRGFAPLVGRIGLFCKRHNVEKGVLALGYLNKAFPNGKIVFGAETAEQVRENIRCWDTELSKEIIVAVDKEFCVEEETILNPSLWPRR